MINSVVSADVLKKADFMLSTAVDFLMQNICLDAVSEE